MSWNIKATRLTFSSKLYSELDILLSLDTLLSPINFIRVGPLVVRLGHGYGYKWTDPGKTASRYHLEAILLDGYPLLKNGADLGDYNVILAYFRVRFKGKVSIYSRKTCIIFLLSLLIIISSLLSLASNTL